MGKGCAPRDVIGAPVGVPGWQQGREGSGFPSKGNMNLGGAGVNFHFRAPNERVFSIENGSKPGA